ncbi:MAG: hypothetical protein P4M00_12805 [Azospirillaceae bacterium]|nr:hypothetical protein [Azospirillaceae bacterium]
MTSVEYRKQSLRWWLARFVVGLGLVLLTMAVGWWWLVFEPTLRGELLTLPQAGSCLAVNSGVCVLAQSLCRGVHLFEIRHYSSGLFWLGIALLGSSPFIATSSHRDLSSL